MIYRFLHVFFILVGIVLLIGALTACSSVPARVVNPHCSPDKTVQTGMFAGFCDETRKP